MLVLLNFSMSAMISLRMILSRYCIKRYAKVPMHAPVELQYDPEPQSVQAEAPEGADKRHNSLPVTLPVHASHRASP